MIRKKWVSKIILITKTIHPLPSSLHFRNNGFLRYYQVKQIPNFILASPVLIISVIGILKYASSDWNRFLWGWSPFFKADKRDKSETTTAHPPHSLLPYIYLWIVLLLYSALFMHIQVIIRFFSAMPCMYWMAASMLLGEEKRDRTTAQYYLQYSILYSALTTILFSNFFPPA